MGEIMNFTNGVKSGDQERVGISFPTCGTRHDLPKTDQNLGSKMGFLSIKIIALI